MQFEITVCRFNIIFKAHVLSHFSVRLNHTGKWLSAKKKKKKLMKLDVNIRLNTPI